MKNKREKPIYPHVNPNSISAIGIQITNKCLLTCDHCGANSHPHGEHGPSTKWLCEFIESISLTNSVDSVMLTGGEPFLRYRDVLQVTDKGRRENIKCEVVSNGFWGANKKVAYKYINELAEAGLHQLTLSVDKFHQSVIDKQSIINICTAAQQINKKILLRIFTIDGKFCDHSFLDELESCFGKDGNIKIYSQPLLPVGRASINRNILGIKGSRLTKKENHPCHMVLFPFVGYTKHWYLCSNASTLSTHTPLCIGQLTNPCDVDKFLEKHFKHNLCRFLKNIGPYELFNLIEYQCLSNLYVSICDLCLHVFNDGTLAEKINQQINTKEVLEALQYIDSELSGNA